VALGRSHRDSPPQRTTRGSTVTVVVMGLIGCILAVLLLLWGTGI
jgi:hypothetical protein